MKTLMYTAVLAVSTVLIGCNTPGNNQKPDSGDSVVTAQLDSTMTNPDASDLKPIKEGPDLIVSDITFVNIPIDNGESSQLDVHVFIKNIGKADINDAKIGVVLYGSSTSGYGFDRIEKGQLITSLKAGSEAEFIWENVPITPRNYFAVVDSPTPTKLPFGFVMEGPLVEAERNNNSLLLPYPPAN